MRSVMTTNARIDRMSWRGCIEYERVLVNRYRFVSPARLGFPVKQSGPMKRVLAPLGLNRMERG
jgi:hypothetical protein